MTDAINLPMTSTVPADSFAEELERAQRATEDAVTVAVALDAARRENANLRRLLWITVEMSGGERVISDYNLECFDPHGMLEITRLPTGEIVLNAYKKEG